MNTKKTYFLISIFILLSQMCMMVACKKKNEVTPPTITVISPLENSSFENKTHIMVHVKATDKNVINWIRVSVNDDNNVAISNLETQKFHLADVETSFDLYLNIPNNASTAAYIVVSASNGELESKKYIKIAVTEKAHDLTGFITIQKDGPYTRIFHENTDGNVLHSIDLQGDYLQSGFESKNQVFVCASKNNSIVKAIKLSDFTEVWTNTDAATYALVVDAESFYVAQANKYITAYYSQGYSIKRSYHEPSFNFYPNCLALGNGVTCSFQWQLVNNGLKKITVFDSYTSGVLKELQTNNMVSDMLHMQNNTFLFLSSNNFGTSKIEQYNYSSNTVEQLYSTTDSIYKMVKINESKVLLLKSFELGIFDCSNSSYNSFKSKPNINAMAYNPVDDLVYISIGNKIEIYEMSGTLQNTITFAHSIDNFCLTYNN